VPKFYWTVTATSAYDAAIAVLGPEDFLPHWKLDPDERELGVADERITAVVEAPGSLPAKVAALGAHATQVVVGPTGRACALSNHLALPVLGHEHYILVDGLPGERDQRGWETDLLAGLQFD
jgi:N-acetyl-1-D-myo-inositol-2-amino-2-deoxy-alpha-D-glucopyranoside deacetylase